MVQLNPHFKELKREYIFPIIEEKLMTLQASSLVPIVNLGIGDVALPLVKTVAEAIAKSADEMTSSEGMHGYGPSEGYLFLREAIAKTAYPLNLISPSEIFISEGINQDCTQLIELFDLGVKIGIPSPTYPAYLDNALLAGRKEHIHLIPCLEENGFIPQIPDIHLDVIYLCTPSNPAGVAMNKDALTAWVEYAKKEKAILLIDHAYEAFITSSDVPRSIYDIPGAKEVAIEMRSFSKSAGFTGLRCAYSVIPCELMDGKIHALWKKRQSIKSNGVSYITQRAAESALSPQGLIETRAQIQHYLSQAKILMSGLDQLNLTYFGGVNAPYIWVKVPSGKTSWEFFDTLLNSCHILSIPGSGFGAHGEGFIRLSTFTTQANLAVERLCLLK
ncbi:MAG: LL-diaminopimelate aminotransferase [Candidatus Rhabdochlamydia sp.]